MLRTNSLVLLAALLLPAAPAFAGKPLFHRSAPPAMQCMKITGMRNAPTPSIAKNPWYPDFVTAQSKNVQLMLQVSKLGKSEVFRLWLKKNHPDAAMTSAVVSSCCSMCSRSNTSG